MTERRVPGTRGVWRRILAWVFLILFCLAAPVALVAGWARLSVIDSGAYVRTVTRAAGDARMRDAVAQGIVRETETRLAGENPTATEALQARAVAEAVGVAARGVVASDEFRATWETANRAAHQLLVTGLAQGRGQPITLDLSPLLDRLQTALETSNIELPPGDALNAEDLQLQILDAATADRLRLAIARVDLAFWATLGVALLSLILAIGLAPDRVAALGRAGFGLAIAMIALIALLIVAQQWLASATNGEGGRLASAAIIDAVSQGLRVSAVGLALAGFVLAGICTGLAGLRRATARLPSAAD
jgi:hypothetical protein